MDGDMEISLDKLPLKRLEAIEENGAERFPSDVGYDDKRVSLIRRIDFAWAVEEEDESNKNKKQKKSNKESSGPWQWQSMMENLQLAHQELSVIIDLINSVEANDAVTVAGMTRPKPLPNEHLSDLAVSTATKLQNYRHLGKYFKQSAKSLEQQINREARFYGALIRLQRNWKVKRQRVAVSGASNEGFTIDLSDSSSYAYSSLSTIRVDHDSAGMLAINLPKDSCHSLHFGFLGNCSTEDPKRTSKLRDSKSVGDVFSTSEVQPANDDEYVKKTHLLLREVHKSIFAEQLFDMVNVEAFNQAVGVNVTGIRENYLQMNIGQGASLFISLRPSSGSDGTKNSKSTTLAIDSADGTEPVEEIVDDNSNKLGFPNHVCCEIYLQQLFHEHVFGKVKDQAKAKSRALNQTAKDASGLLGHFWLSLAHRIFSNRVLVELEKVVCRVPYLRLTSHPTWNSRISSWTVFLSIPLSIIPIGSSVTQSPDGKRNMKSQFWTKVAVNDDRITVEGECSPSIVGLFKGSSCNLFPMSKYDCDLADLPVTILQQVASQILYWLVEEAQTVGVKANLNFLSLSFEIEQGEIVRLMANVDPEDEEGCISWWLVMEDGFSEEGSFHTDTSDGKPDYRKFLGHLSLEVLYSTLMDLISLCSGGQTL